MRTQVGHAKNKMSDSTGSLFHFELQIAELGRIKTPCTLRPREIYVAVDSGGETLRTQSYRLKRSGRVSVEELLFLKAHVGEKFTVRVYRSRAVFKDVLLGSAVLTFRAADADFLNVPLLDKKGRMKAAISMYLWTDVYEQLPSESDQNSEADSDFLPMLKMYC